jgi:hypothetical protein
MSGQPGLEDTSGWGLVRRLPDTVGDRLRGPATTPRIDNDTN